MKKNKRRHPLVVILILILLAGMGFLCYNLLNIKTIAVAGNEKKTADYIVRLSEVQAGENILRVDDNLIKQNIEKDPYLKLVEVQRVYPDKIVLKVQERKPAALIKTGTANMLVDEEGYILEMPNDISKLKYPVVDGINAGSFQIGKQIGFSDKAQYLAMNSMIKAIYAEKAEELISEIDLININDIHLKSAVGITVSFGNYSKLEKKILWIKNVLPRLQSEGKTDGTLDVSSGESATYSEGGV